jgi:hypothetical protein
MANVLIALPVVVESVATVAANIRCQADLTFTASREGRALRAALDRLKRNLHVNWGAFSHCNSISYLHRGEEHLPVVANEVQGIEGLLDSVLKIARGLPEGAFLWYRGHQSSHYRLLPSLLRDGKPADEIFEREKRLLTRFRQRSLPFWPGGYPQNDWEHLFAMQHHGVPTRLLDWSENLFIAAHFALSGKSDEEDLPILWCIDPINWNRSAPVLSEYGDHIHVLTTSDEESEAYRPETSRRRSKSPVAIFGTHNSTRIVAQRGTFMVWGEDLRTLEEFAGESRANLWRFKIKGARDVLRRELIALGFVETMIYPELTSLALELSRVEGWRTVK